MKEYSYEELIDFAKTEMKRSEILTKQMHVRGEYQLENDWEENRDMMANIVTKLEIAQKIEQIVIDGIVGNVGGKKIKSMAESSAWTPTEIADTRTDEIIGWM